jgi:predicted PurR-regulated permease PerM
MKARFNNSYFKTGLTAFIVIAASLLFFTLLSRWSGIFEQARSLFAMLNPVWAGIILAYLLTPIMASCERSFLLPFAKSICKKDKQARKLSRALGVVCALAILILIVAGFMQLVLPSVIDSVERLMSNMDRYVNAIRNWVMITFATDTELEDTAVNWVNTAFRYIRSWLETSVLSRADSIAASISSGVITVIQIVVNIIIGIIVSAYLLFSKEHFAAQIKKSLYSILPNGIVNRVIRGAHEVHHLFGGFLRGKILASFIVGAICAVFMAVARMPYIALIAILIGITNIIPFVGPFIGAVPSALLLLLDNPLNCLIFVIFIIALQTFDGYILSAKLISNSTGLSGFWVIVSIFIGGGLLGFVGMIIGVPIFAVLYQIIRTAMKKRLEKKKLPVATTAYENGNTY